MKTGSTPETRDDAETKPVSSPGSQLSPACNEGPENLNLFLSVFRFHHCPAFVTGRNAMALNFDDPDFF